eukprot:CAMPEP_0177235090 /NCGR_PEP_ID=MMETSP0367-20130122/44742_1 /TAXON_ID=447022 ORGANISM="Scrippsiella hangoei-like, Strain SHHI-4" /NCGR_SAMPLE_ID=MMETSP0367 /ASSEMBLY_ACC=CAM_ASM_000362 /LENGTH=301 /DNA_ID=CAMNT_0018685923 /DNA_START=144 /DNA_END=1049 /DNA_ORIENTATION=+
MSRQACSVAGSSADEASDANAAGCGVLADGGSWLFHFGPASFRKTSCTEGSSFAPATLSHSFWPAFFTCEGPGGTSALTSKVARGAPEESSESQHNSETFTLPRNRRQFEHRVPSALRAHALHLCRPENVSSNLMSYMNFGAPRKYTMEASPVTSPTLSTVNPSSSLRPCNFCTRCCHHGNMFFSSQVPAAFHAELRTAAFESEGAPWASATVAGSIFAGANSFFSSSGFQSRCLYHVPTSSLTTTFSFSFGRNAGAVEEELGIAASPPSLPSAPSAAAVGGFAQRRLWLCQSSFWQCPLQ